MFGIIFNPVSGGGKSTAMAEQIGGIIRERGDTYCVFKTESAGDGANQARKALDEGCDAVVCIGGDGTLSEVVQAVAQSGVPLYIVPGGTGNDFARMLKLPKDPLKAFCAQLDGERRTIDCGSVNGKAFLNVAGSGFDVEVLRKTEELKAKYSGGKAYSKAVLAVLSSYQAFEADISVDAEAFAHHRCTIVEVANGRFIGGGMSVAPHACYDDGLFDVVIVDRVPRRAIPFLLPLFKLGLHVYLPVARVIRAKSVTIRAKNMTANIDGRLESMDKAHFEILPGALTVMEPKN